MRILLSFLLLAFTFSYAVENCRIERVPDPDQIQREKDKIKIPPASGGWTYSLTHVEYNEYKTKFYWVGEARHTSGTVTKWYPMDRLVDVIYISKDICDSPVLPEPKKCTETYCSGADKKRWESATWYESGSGCSSQNFSMKTISGGKQVSITYTCENPKKSSGPICIRYYDEPVACEESDNENEVSPLPDDIDIPEDLNLVPCFGNVEGCNSTSLPDYIDPETGVPCWGQGCNNATPPDSIGSDGVPCWGDRCGISPPINKPGDGSGSGGDGSGSGGDGSGSGGDGSGSGGNGSGSGGNGEGEGTGDNEGWGDCPAGGCPDNSGLINGKGFAKVPDTFHETKYRDKALEDALDAYIKENPFDFGTIDTDLGVSGSCPVNWSIPFLHGTSINFGIPCSVFDQLRSFFIFLSYLFGFYHIFRKRG